MRKQAFKSKSQLRARRRKRRLILAGLGAALFLALVGGLAALAHAPFGRIASVEVSGAQTVPAERIAQSAQRSLEGSYLFIVPRDSVLFYSKDDVRERLKAEFPTLESVEMSIRSEGALRIAVSERQGQALWCASPEAAIQSCIFLDNTGLAYASAAGFSGGAHVRYTGPLSGVRLPKQYLTSERFGALQALLMEFSEEAGAATAVSVEENRDARASFASGFKLYFSLNDDGAGVLERFTVALGAEPFKGRSLSDFSYLDLRFGDKLFYKPKNAPEAAEVPLDE